MFGSEKVQGYIESVNACATTAIGMVVGAIVMGMRGKGMTPEEIGEEFANIARIQDEMASVPEVVRAQAAQEQLMMLARDSFGGAMPQASVVELERRGLELPNAEPLPFEESAAAPEAGPGVPSEPRSAPRWAVPDPDMVAAATVALEQLPESEEPSSLGDPRPVGAGPLVPGSDTGFPSSPSQHELDLYLAIEREARVLRAGFFEAASELEPFSNKGANEFKAVASSWIHHWDSPWAKRSDAEEIAGLLIDHGLSSFSGLDLHASGFVNDLMARAGLDEFPEGWDFVVKRLQDYLSPRPDLSGLDPDASGFVSECMARAERQRQDHPLCPRALERVRIAIEQAWTPYGLEMAESGMSSDLYQPVRMATGAHMLQLLAYPLPLLERNHLSVERMVELFAYGKARGGITQHGDLKPRAMILEEGLREMVFGPKGPGHAQAVQAWDYMVAIAVDVVFDRWVLVKQLGERLSA